LYLLIKKKLANTFGKLFTLTTFGESHGTAIGGIIDGCHPGLELDFSRIQIDLDRRKPGQSSLVSPRKENDEVKFLSGLFEGKTTGAPIGFIIENNNQNSSDYSHLKETYRPSHADFTYQQKYGIRDYNGGGRASARETACRVVGGAIAKQILLKHNITINAFVSAIGSIQMQTKDYIDNNLWLQNYTENIVRCPDEQVAKKFIQLIESTKLKGDTVGGVITCICNNVPSGIGEPIFDKLQANLAFAMMSIQATKGFEYGEGFKAAEQFGSKLNDVFTTNIDGKIVTETNNSGGIQGGISNGMPVYFNVAFKPVATLMQSQKSINEKGEEIVIEPKGRHDACVLPRAVPIVEAMCALVLVDLLKQRNAII
jgi:chorismate synthase